jgi:Concanavalin A-like lectin/glucanases superfamily
MRTFIRLFASATALAMLLLGADGRAEGQTCVPSPPGLVGWWPGNGTANDAVAGNNGQLAGDATFAQAVVSQGFKLDGFGDYVEIPDSPALKPAHVSVEAWVRFDSLDTPIVSQFGALGLQYIVFKKNSRVFNFEAYALRKQRDGSVDRLAFSVADVNGSGGTNVAQSTTPVVIGQFYHVVGTYDGSSVRLYVNGALEGQSALFISVDYGSRPVFIGTSGEPVFDGKLNGVVDEASIYNRALDASEIAALYGAGAAGKCASATGLLTSLATFVQTLNLSSGISNSLDMKLQNALQALDAASAGDSPSACNRIGAFLNEVSAQTEKTVTASQAAQLTTLAQHVRAALQCR